MKNLICSRVVLDVEIKSSLESISKKVRASTSYQYKIFIVAFISLIIIFCTSNFYLPQISNINFTQAGETKKLDSTSITLKSFTYNPDNCLLETVFKISNPSNNYHQEFSAQAINNSNKKFETSVSHSSSELLAVNTTGVKQKDFSAIKISVSLVNQTDNNSKSADFICTPENIVTDKNLTTDNQKEKFAALNIKFQIEDTQVEIQKLETENSNIAPPIKPCH